LMRYLVRPRRAPRGAVVIAGEAKRQFDVGRPAFGVVFQSGALFASMTVGENVGLPLVTWTDLNPDSHWRHRERKALPGRAPRTGRQAAFELSGGMSKRAAIARAMALEPVSYFSTSLQPGSTRLRLSSWTI